MEVNLSMSQIFYFNMPIKIQCHITQLLGFTHNTLPYKYLAIPLIKNSLRNTTSEDLLSNFRKKLASWSFLSLNLSSHLILLKSILQALAIYTFSVLAAPSFILKILKKIQRIFLWKGAKYGRKWALVSWKKTYKPKHVGGLELKDPSLLNKFLSEKIWWRWLKMPQDLWACIWRRKYTPSTPKKELIRWNGQGLGYLIYNVATQNRGLITDHAFWELQDGTSIFFWSDS
jgi:hypothetical protein